jgi:hypothetical protein
MVGDTLKKAGIEHDEALVNIRDLGDTEYGTSKVSVAERRVFLSSSLFSSKYHCSPF